MVLGIDNPLKTIYFCHRCKKEVKEKKAIEEYERHKIRFPILDHRIYHKKCLEIEKRLWSGYKPPASGYIYD